MKVIVSFLFVLFIGGSAHAQQGNKSVALETASVEMQITNGQKTSKEANKEVARVYKFKNSRIKKELSFTTKRNRAKLA
ncbi:hypothetical protein [Arenibacter amylolyticus]|uniref:hypothetical protein n=1 Tax=Arenibacter amylolyticus TaxID=1406873 RepID=UPI000A378266|nr:hypothetical protein [Arenibacter amylolyticus]